MAPPSSGFIIRRAAPADADGILTCLRAAFAPYQSDYTPPAYEDTVLNPETLAQRFQFMSIFIAVSELDEIVGTVGCNAVGNKEGHLRGMAVLADWQGRGVAQQLLAHAEAELRVLGCERVTLDTTVPLQRAIRFYERNGYRATSHVSDFFGMPLFEYAKPLGSH